MCVYMLVWYIKLLLSSYGMNSGKTKLVYVYKVWPTADNTVHNFKLSRAALCYNQQNLTVVKCAVNFRLRISEDSFLLRCVAVSKDTWPWRFEGTWFVHVQAQAVHDDSSGDCLTLKTEALWYSKRWKQRYNVTSQKTWSSATLLWEPQMAYCLRRPACD
jgi:hypothetical protein